MHVEPTCRPKMQVVARNLNDALLASGIPIPPPEMRIEGMAPEQLAKLHNNIGMVFLKQLARSQTDFRLAEEHLEESRSITEKINGNESAEYADALNNLAACLFDQVSG